jgi:hypothetical protein
MLVTQRLSSVLFERIYQPAGASPVYLPSTTAPRYSTQFPTYPTTSSTAGGATMPQVSYAAPLGYVTSGPPVAVAAAFNSVPDHNDFVNVAHAFWALLFATLGGWFTRWVHATRPKLPDPSASSDTTSTPAEV